MHGMADTVFSSDVQQSKCRCAPTLINGYIDVVDWSDKRYAFSLQERIRARKIFASAVP